MSSLASVVIGVTGLPASGKGVFAEIAKQHGFIVIVMGDVIREEVRKRGLPVNREHSNKIMIELRKEHGEGVVALKTIPWVKEALNKGNHRILIDGLRSLTEAEILRQQFPEFLIIGIHASPKVRYDRIRSRHRKDDSSTWDEFHKRDELELSVGIGDLLALSDILVSNQGNIEEAKKQFDEVISDVLDLFR